MSKSVDHIVRRPGRRLGDHDVSFYSRVEPLKNPDLEKTADREWGWSVYTQYYIEYRSGHNERYKSLIDAAEATGDLDPIGTPPHGNDVSEDIRHKARELGF